MYVYKQGAIGEIIHSKIQAAKQSVRGKKTASASFGDTLKAYISENTSKKPVSVSNKNNGSTVMYAMKNSDTDSTAAAVLNKLGYKQYGTASNMLKTAADELSASAASLRTVLESGTAETKTIALSKLADAYNAMNTRLGAAGSTSGYLYRSALNGYTAGDALDGSGLAVNDDGALVLSGEEADAEKLAPFLTGISTVAGNISAYSDVIAGTNSTDNGLDNYSTLGSYYTAMMNLMQ